MDYVAIFFLITGFNYLLYSRAEAANLDFLKPSYLMDAHPISYVFANTRLAI